MRPPVVIAERSRLVAEGLHELLTELGLDVVSAVTDDEQLSKTLVDDTAPRPLVLLGAAFAPSVDLPAVVAAITEAGRTCLVLLDTDDVEPLELLEAGALGLVPAEADSAELARTVQAALRGEACIPRGMLAEVLRSLIERRRVEEVARERYGRLSRREREVVGLLAEGLSTEEIADRLVISPHTVRTHLCNSMGKLGVQSQVEAVRLLHVHRLHHVRSTA